MENDAPDGHDGALFALYAAADAAVAEFARRGLRCAYGCGVCCLGTLPDISLFESVPLAAFLHRTPLLAARFEAALPLSSSPCFFHLPESPRHCSVYGIRPLACRLFGFAGTRGKDGRALFRPCRRMEGRSGVTTDVTDIPLFQDFAGRLLAAAPPQLARRAPFGEALTEAYARLGLVRALASADSPPEDWDGNHRPPLPSFTTPRAA